MKEKLLQRWENIDPVAEEFGPVRMMVDPDMVNKAIQEAIHSHLWWGFDDTLTCPSLPVGF